VCYFLAGNVVSPLGVAQMRVPQPAEDVTDNEAPDVQTISKEQEKKKTKRRPKDSANLAVPDIGESSGMRRSASTGKP
jgi:hypothetical protein